MFPSLSQYNKAIQQQDLNTFKTLERLFFIPARTSPIKIYSFGSGSYAVVFKALENNKEIAIRCFIGSDNDYVERYRKIDSYLKNINESWKTNIEFLDNEIKVDGVYYPVLKMDWVDGKLLDKFIGDNLYDNEKLTKIQKQIVKISESLEKNKIGHGDIQCGNIIVQEVYSSPVVKLIDYDGLYIPEFFGLPEKERGRSEFQHPNRSYFGSNEKIDRFSFWIIICAIEALKFDKSLWKETMQGGFNTLDNMLFVGSDFSNPNRSQLFNKLHSLNQPSLNYYIDKIKLSLNSSNVPKPSLFGENEPLDDSPIFREPKVNKTNLLPVYISSMPSGASVRDENFINIGNTPITLDRNKFLNTSIKIISGIKCESIIINEFTKDIKIDFSLDPEPKIDLKEQYTRVDTPIIEEPVVTGSSKNYSSLIIILIIFIVIAIFGLILTNEKNNSNNSLTLDYLDSAAMVVDSAAAVVDSAAAIVDTIAYDYTDSSIVDTTALLDSDSSPTLINNTNQSGQSVIDLRSSYFFGDWYIGGRKYTFVSNGEYYYVPEQGDSIWNKWRIEQNEFYLGIDNNSGLLTKFIITSYSESQFIFKLPHSQDIYTAYRR